MVTNPSSETTETMFAGLATLCVLAGIGSLFVCVLLFFVGWREFKLLGLGMAMLFAGLANYFAFKVLHCLASEGYKVGTFRTYKDLRLYSEYWNIAPQKHWSRFPMIAFVLSFCIAACLLFLTLLMPSH